MQTPENHDDFYSRRVTCKSYVMPVDMLNTQIKYNPILFTKIISLFTQIQTES